MNMWSAPTLNIIIKSGFSPRRTTGVSRNEAPRTKIFNDQYYVILPQYNDPALEEKYKDLPAITETEFTSRNARQLSDQEFTEVLKKESWLWDTLPAEP